MPDKKAQSNIASCAHCELELHPDVMQFVTVSGEELQVCCTGCGCAAQLLGFLEEVVPTKSTSAKHSQ